MIYITFDELLGRGSILLSRPLFPSAGQPELIRLGGWVFWDPGWCSLWIQLVKTVFGCLWWLQNGSKFIKVYQGSSKFIKVHQNSSKFIKIQVVW